MSFWRTFGFTTISPVETILDRDHYTLEELLDEEELLQETKAQNKKLIPFLTKTETLEKLIHFITTEPEDISDPRRRLKYPFLSCEVLCSEVWRISESIYENPFLLDKLYAFLDLAPPLNPLLATYVCRVASVLLQRKIPQTIKYLKQKEGMIDKFIQHLGSSAVMDLLLKLIACEDTSEGKGVLEWLCSENLIPRLVAKFEPALGTEVHENAAQAIVDIICVSSNNNNNNNHMMGNTSNNTGTTRSPLIIQLESEETINQLLSFILAEGATSTLLNGLTVVNELLKRNVFDPNTQTQENYKQTSDLSALLRLLSDNFDHFKNLLINPPLTEQQRVNQRNRGDEESLGFYRLKVVEFIVGFVRTNYDCVSEIVIKHNVLSTCLQLFFKFDLNNFLHSLVEQLIDTILKSDNHLLQLHLLEESNLIGLIVDASQTNEAQYQRPKGFRKPYMGYITTISVHLLNAANSNKLIADKLNENEEWKKYIDGAFNDIRQIETKALGGHKPLTFSENINEEEEEMAETSAQAVFTQYLAQQGYAGTYQDVDDDYDDDENEAFDAENDFDQRIVLNADEKASFHLVGDDDDDEDDHHDDDEDDEHHDDDHHDQHDDSDHPGQHEDHSDS